MDEIIIHSVQEYINVLEKIPLDFCLSRGQSLDKKLLPTALRFDEDNKRLYSKSKVNCFLEDYKINSAIYMPQGQELKNEYEWMVYAQHFGVPTQLLDFTYSHIISLMFAVEKAFSENDMDKKAVVWFLNPKKLNEYSMNRTEIIN
ncbi:MAG: FRG domain-containing protein, partial [Clostridiaceae bacterium]|nr:FRG domain-containing protein [Clostridiaceae bacterium]